MFSKYLQSNGGDLNFSRTRYIRVFKELLPLLQVYLCVGDFKAEELWNTGNSEGRSWIATCQYLAAARYNLQMHLAG